MTKKKTVTTPTQVKELLNLLPEHQLAYLINEGQQALKRAQYSAMNTFLHNSKENIVKLCENEGGKYLVFNFDTQKISEIVNYVQDINKNYLKTLYMAGIQCNMHTVVDPPRDAVSIGILISTIPTYLQEIVKTWEEADKEGKKAADGTIGEMSCSDLLLLLENKGIAHEKK